MPVSPGNRPQTLLRQLVVIALVSMLAILLLATFGLHRVYSRHVIANAEEDAVSIGEALLELERDALLSPGPDGRLRLAVAAEDLPRLDRRLRQLLRPFEIVKVKVFDPDGRILYSTDPTIIGRVDRDNRRLARALAGDTDSKLERKEAVLDLADERKIDVDVVETYLPIGGEQGEVLGSFEVYVDVTRYRDEIRRGTLTSALLLGGVLLFVFGVAFLVVREGTRRLRQAQAALEAMAITDPLTGLANRRQVLARAEEELARHEREREGRPEARPPGLVLLDLDRFKKVNDTHGHLAGDEVLKEVAARIAGSIRGYDAAGRYGGEEFLAVLPGAGFAETVAIGERIRQAIGERPVAVGAARIPVTASLGVACPRPGERELAAILQRADTALYLAKDRGRNRVAWVDGEEAAPAGAG